MTVIADRRNYPGGVFGVGVAVVDSNRKALVLYPNLRDIFERLRQPCRCKGQGIDNSCDGPRFVAGAVGFQQFKPVAAGVPNACDVHPVANI